MRENLVNKNLCILIKIWTGYINFYWSNFLLHTRLDGVLIISV